MDVWGLKKGEAQRGMIPIWSRSPNQIWLCFIVLWILDSRLWLENYQHYKQYLIFIYTDRIETIPRICIILF